MDNDMNLKELWSQQITEPSTVEVLISKFAKIKNMNLIRLMVFTWLYFQPKWVTTKIGIVVTIL